MRSRAAVVLLLVLLCLVLDVAHVDAAELDRLGVVVESVDDGVSGYPVGHFFRPLSWPGLGRDDRRGLVFPVDQTAEEIATCFAVDSDSHEVNNEQFNFDKRVEAALLLVGSFGDRDPVEQFAGR